MYLTNNIYRQLSITRQYLAIILWPPWVTPFYNSVYITDKQKDVSVVNFSYWIHSIVTNYWCRSNKGDQLVKYVDIGHNCPSGETYNSHNKLLWIIRISFFILSFSLFLFLFFFWFLDKLRCNFSSAVIIEQVSWNCLRLFMLVLQES